MRLKGVGVDGDAPSPLNTSSSGASPVALWLVIGADTCFLLLLAAETLVRLATQGAAHLADPWARLDLLVLAVSIARALFSASPQAYVRSLAPFYPNPNLLTRNPKPRHQRQPQPSRPPHPQLPPPLPPYPPPHQHPHPHP